MQFIFDFCRFIAMTSTQLIEIAIDHFLLLVFLLRSDSIVCLFVCVSNKFFNIYAKEEYFYLCIQSISSEKRVSVSLLFLVN